MEQDAILVYCSILLTFLALDGIRMAALGIALIYWRYKNKKNISRK